MDNDAVDPYCHLLRTLCLKRTESHHSDRTNYVEVEDIAHPSFKVSEKYFPKIM